MSSNAVAVANRVRDLKPKRPQSERPGPGWGDLWDQAFALVRSGFLPAAIKTPEQAIAIILTGQELGLPKMLALRSIHVINGRPTLSADLMASLVQREIDRRGDGLLMVQPPDDFSCTVKFRRWGWKDEQAFSFTLDDAKRAGLLGKDTWKQHPGAMLRARATAAVCRMAFPDVIAGLYDPHELAEMPAFEDLPPEESADAFAAAPGWVNEDLGDDDDDILDAETDDIVLGQATLADEVVEANGVDMISSHQRGEILWLAEKLDWVGDDEKADLRRIDAFAGEITGISSLKNLSAQRAGMVITAMREQLPKLVPRS